MKHGHNKREAKANVAIRRKFVVSFSILALRHACCYRHIHRPYALFCDPISSQSDGRCKLREHATDNELPTPMAIIHRLVVAPARPLKPTMDER